MREIIAYCTTYKEERCLALRVLATQITQPASSPAGTTPTSLSVAATADKHLSAAVPLGLSNDQVLLLVVTGIVADDRGQPVANAEVRIAGMTVMAPTAADGSYRVSFFGTGTTLVTRRVNITVERAAVDVALKPAGDGSPIVGIAADGMSRLIFGVTSHGIRPESVTVATPTLGRFERATPASSPIAFDKEGKGTLVYIPPSVLPDEALTTSVVLGTGSAARTVAAASVSIDVRYADLDGVTQTTTVGIKVCRPPVLLVQSFLGGPASWTPFADFARARRLDCQITGEGVAWGLGNASLADWATELARSISEAEATYAASGIRISAVDMVAHSSSGLVARSLLEGTDPRRDVRRLLLVGTPNHGLAWLDQEVGAVASRWLASHPTAAAELHEGSAFLRQLGTPGAGDRTVEYVNVVGRRTPSLSASQQGSSTVQDDGIVSAASSHLDGVPEIRLDGVVHASGLPIGGTGLTESSAVWTKLVDLLVGAAPRAEPDTLRIELRRGRQVSTSKDLQTTPWTPVSKFPVLLQESVGLRTGDRGYAAIAVVQAGEMWGTISLDTKTEVVLLASSPSLIRVEVVSGRARFHASGTDAGDFEVVLDASPRSTLWYTAQPEIRTIAVKGDYVVAREETTSVIALGGTVLAEYAKGVGFLPPRLVEAGTGVRIRANGAIEDEIVPTHGWWESGVWRETLPSFRFPLWLMGLMLVGLAGATIYHLRARPQREEEPRQSPPS
jgi:pimeloyl-ACP methyl ester carboxylesterase